MYKQESQRATAESMRERGREHEQREKNFMAEIQELRKLTTKYSFMPVTRRPIIINGGMKQGEGEEEEMYAGIRGSLRWIGDGITTAANTLASTFLS